MMERRRQFIGVGEVYVTRNPSIITTVLGSCVAVCLWSEGAHAGGMNHFRLPVWEGRGASPNEYGDISIRNLLKRMTGVVASRGELCALVFGGGNLLCGESGDTVGGRNLHMAVETLEAEEIRIVSVNPGMQAGMKIEFDTLSGNVRVSRVQPSAVE
jgi:chemotaxis protein CheD